MNQLTVRWLLLFFLATSQLAALEPNDGPLARYVSQADASYKWTKKREGMVGPTSYCELILTSQTWREIVWKHQLFVIKPSTCPPDAKHALLMITGGGWKDELERPADNQKLPRDAQTFVTLAEQLKSPVAVLLHVPHQPIFDGKYEDAIIAYTFDKYLETGDETWPLLLPMVKSAVRGMDAVQEFARQEWSLGIETFTVTGASKRGWTTWLTGAVDRRATAIAPMVIDVLNMPEHMKYQKEVFGEFSSEINDYTERGLQDKLQTERGQRLTKIVDPFNYRDALTQPKLILIGTNDPYWPVDALKLYWDELPGEKYVLYVPNADHGLDDLGRVVGSLSALHGRAISGKPLPQLTGQFRRSDTARTETLTIRSDVRPRRVQVWSAKAATRDFRAAAWRSAPASVNGEGTFSYELAIPETGFAAMFGEAVYDGDAVPFFLSTNIKVFGAEASGEVGKD